MNSFLFPLLTVFLLVACAMAAFAYEVEHPVFPRRVAPERVPEMKTQTEKVLAFSRAEIDAWIVAKSSFEMVACPNCEWPGGRRDRKNYWRWSPDDPERIRCAHCDTTYPDNRYPMSAVQRTPDPTGQVQEYPYYPGKDGYRYYLVGKVDNARKQYMEGVALRLADLYVATKDARYARQAAQILDRLALAYPHYNVQICRRAGSPLLLEQPLLKAPEDGLVPVPPFGKGTAGQDDGAYYPYWSNRRGDGWNGWLYSEMPLGLAYAYDAIATSEELDRLSGELGRDVRAHIRGFLRETANFSRSFPPYAGNMDPSLIQGFAVIGRVIGEPELVHDALRRVKLILDLRFFPDGNWREAAPSYHSQTIGGLRSAAASALKGYSDPPGYTGRDDGLHLENLDITRDLPMLEDSFRALAAIALPTGSSTCIHDTWSPTTNGRPLRAPDKEPMPSHLHWGLGHAILGTGRKDTGTQAHLHFSGGYGHTHADTLNLILFGKGRELACDIGYTHTVMAAYSRHSLAHNLVVVDEQDQRQSGTEPPADGYLIASARLGSVAQYVEAGGEGAYPERTRLYRRALALVSTPDGEAYTLDLFRVAGGAKHDWVLHGSADEEMELQSTLPTQAHPAGLLRPGVTFKLWKDEYGRNMQDGVNLSYGLFRDTRRASGEETWSARLECRDGSGVRTTFLGLPGAEVFHGRLPSVRRAREDSSRVMDFWMPTMLVRRQGTNLQSVFTAVHQAYAAGTPALSVARLPVESEDGMAAGVVVRGNGFTDYHLCGTEPTSALRVAAPAIRAVGRYAFIRVIGERVAARGVVDGSALEYEGERLEVAEGATAEVTAVRNAEAGDAENAVVVAAALTPRAGLPDERVIVRFPNGMTYGLAVKAIRREGEASVITLAHRPGFRLLPDGKTAMTHHPMYEWAGRPTLHLPGVGWRNE